MKPKIYVLRTDGTNCDNETKYAFDLVGGDAEIVHINSLKKGYDPVQQKKIKLDDVQILALPGGFSYGDYIGAGNVFAQELNQSLGDEINDFIDKDKLIIGICNGFQVLVKAGLLPRLNYKNEQTVTLTYNDSGNFEDRWVRLRSPVNNCIWTKYVENIDLPVAHGEGEFIADEKIIEELFRKKLVVYQYADSNGKPTMKFPKNPNGSIRSIAGICDESGKIFGLMPHPERYWNPGNHPHAPLQKILSRDYVDKSILIDRLKEIGELPDEGLGLQIFRNGVNYFK